MWISRSIDLRWLGPLPSRHHHWLFWTSTPHLYMYMTLYVFRPGTGVKVRVKVTASHLDVTLKAFG